jgi:hypothetical protein
MFREILRRRGLFASDSKTISVPLAVPGVMKWTSVGGVAYPKPSKASYAVGEAVLLDFAWTNTGGAVAAAVITVVDTGTGATVWTHDFGTTPAPGETSLATGVKIGTMPNKNWNLRCDISP